MRWPLIRNTLLVLLVGTGIALAAKRGKTQPEATVPATEPPAEAPVAAPAPGLFTTPLPIALTQVPDGLATVSAQSCAACHGSVHDQWSGSAHNKAWSGADFQAALSRTGGTTACSSCHLPLTQQHARVAVGYIDGDLGRPDMRANPSWDATLMSEGVTCAACHVREGTVIGTRTVEGGPHAVVASAELSSSTLCASCHQLSWPGADRPIYDTYGEWERSAFSKAGVRCQDCHMPQVASLATATRFAATASHSLERQAARALTVLVQPSTPEVTRGTPWALTVRVLNTGAGHNFPTGSPFRSRRLEMSLVDTDGKALVPPWTHELGRRVSDQPPWTTLSDSSIPAGGELNLSASFNVDQKKKAGQARLQVDLVQRSGDKATGRDVDRTTLLAIPVALH
jgi:hypothetical protein